MEGGGGECLSSNNTYQTNLQVDSLTSFPSAMKSGGGGIDKKSSSAFATSITQAINYFETKRTVQRVREDGEERPDLQLDIVPLTSPDKRLSKTAKKPEGKTLEIKAVRMKPGGTGGAL